jgi:quercetin dioxygenase-like cupin family protein
METMMKRFLFPILILLVLIAALSTGVVRSGAASHPATSSAAAQPVLVGPPLQVFVATGLPRGSVVGVPLHQRFPTGFTLKHLHPGNRYIFVISGTVQISDTAGSKTYSAGMFFWEPAWHVHTLHVVQEAEIFSLTFVAPGAQPVTPVK